MAASHASDNDVSVLEALNVHIPVFGSFTRMLSQTIQVTH